MLMFDVHGPFKIPLRRERGSYLPAKCPEFWKDHQEYRKMLGCYLFALRAGKGYRPIYVGKTVKSFEAECFADHKIARHYTPALARRGRGTPVMFFVVPERKRGKPNGKTIKELETFLIQVGATKNPELSNVKENSAAKWGICGIVRGGQGKPTHDAQVFKKAIGIK
jgi:hypothetical protein